MQLFRQIKFLCSNEQHNEALELWKSESSDLIKDENYYRSQIQLSNSLVVTGQKEEALKFISSSLEFLPEESNSTFISNAYNVMGTIAHIDQDYAESLINFQKAYNVVASIPHLEKEKGNILNNIGSIQMLLEDYEGAEGNISKAIELLEFMGDFESASKSYGNLARIYQLLKEYDKSLACLHRGLELVNTEKQVELVSELIMLECLGLIGLDRKEKAREKFRTIPITPEQFSQNHSRVRYQKIQKDLNIT